QSSFDYVINAMYGENIDPRLEELLSEDKTVRGMQFQGMLDRQSSNPMRGALGLTELSDVEAARLEANPLQEQLYDMRNQWQQSRASLPGYRGNSQLDSLAFI